MRTVTKIAVISLGLGLFSCLDSQKLIGYHSGIVPRDSMINILLEIQLAESYRNLRYIQGTGDSLQSEWVRGLYDEVFERYQLTATRFDSSYNFYQQQDPVVLDGMYAEVNEKLSQQLSEQKR